MNVSTVAPSSSTVRAEPDASSEGSVDHGFASLFRLHESPATHDAPARTPTRDTSSRSNRDGRTDGGDPDPGAGRPPAHGPAETRGGGRPVDRSARERDVAAGSQAGGSEDAVSNERDAAGELTDDDAEGPRAERSGASRRATMPAPAPDAVLGAAALQPGQATGGAPLGVDAAVPVAAAMIDGVDGVAVTAVAGRAEPATEPTIAEVASPGRPGVSMPGGLSGAGEPVPAPIVEVSDGPTVGFTAPIGTSAEGPTTQPVAPQTVTTEVSTDTASIGVPTGDVPTAGAPTAGAPTAGASSEAPIPDVADRPALTDAEPVLDASPDGAVVDAPDAPPATSPAAPAAVGTLSSAAGGESSARATPAAPARSILDRVTAQREAEQLLARAEVRRLTSPGAGLGLDVQTADLGTIRIEAVDRGDGLHLQLGSEHASTRSTLQRHLHELREQLRHEGIDEAFVSVADQGTRREAEHRDPSASPDRNGRSTPDVAVPDRLTPDPASTSASPPASAEADGGVDIRI